MREDDPRCGTEAGHEQHTRDGETCEDCYQAKLRAARRRGKRKRMGHIYITTVGDDLAATLADLRRRGATHEAIASWAGVNEHQAWRACQGPETRLYARTKIALLEMEVGPILTPVGITRRIRALAYVGYSNRAVAEDAGVDADTITDARRHPRVIMAHRVMAAIAESYERLSLTPPTGETRAERAAITNAQNRARKQGWAPPLAWDDIDDPDARPDTGTKDRPKHTVDEVVVERVMRGERLPMTRAERIAVVSRMRAEGIGCIEIEERTGIAKPYRYAGPGGVAA